MRLYSGPLSMFGAKVEIALREKLARFDVEMVPFDLGSGYTPKHPEVLRVNPKRQVPVLIDNEIEIFDSTQIFEYLEDRFPTTPLWPAAIAERAEARRLEHCADEVFFPHVIRLMGLRSTPDPIESPEWIESCNGINTYYLSMERQLAGRPYLATTFSYADIAFYMAQFFAARHTCPIPQHHPNLLGWRERMFERASVNSVVTQMGIYLGTIGLRVPVFGKEPALAGANDARTRSA